MKIVIGTKPDTCEHIQLSSVVLLKQLSLDKKRVLIRCDLVHDRLLALFKRTTRGCLLLAKPPESVYMHETSMNIPVTTNILRIGQEGPDIPPPYPDENYHLHTNENSRSENTPLYSTTTKRGLSNYEQIKYTYKTINIQTNTIIYSNTDQTGTT